MLFSLHTRETGFPEMRQCTPQERCGGVGGGGMEVGGVQMAIVYDQGTPV